MFALRLIEIEVVFERNSQYNDATTHRMEILTKLSYKGSTKILQTHR
jgi:hypothetical protein